MKKFLLLPVLLTLTLLLPAWDVTTSDNPTPAEKTAVAELTNYLQKSVKNKVTINGQDAHFYVGTLPDGVEAPKLAEEEWRIWNDGNRIILLGGGSRGTLYAVYRFLEDELKIRWWTAQTETVPEYDTLALGELNKQGKPYFAMRDIYQGLSRALPDGVWNYRNRLNRNGDTPAGADLGGSFTYGSPYHVHTFEHYFTAAGYLAVKPEYFSMIDGKRVGGQLTGQLCLTNPDLRKEMIDKLRFFIRRDRTHAQNAGIDYPKLYDISPNDNYLYCRCPECLKASEGKNQSDVLLDFINHIAAAIQEEYPDIYVATLAYLYSEEPPLSTRANDNVVVRFCDTSTNPAQPFSAPGNRRFLERLEKWSKLVKNLSIWDYSIIYVRTGMPFPYEYTLSENVKLLRDNQVKMVFFEHENPENADMWELSCFLEAKLLENPDADVQAWTREFLQNYYGAAAPLIQEYRDALYQSSLENPPLIGWYASPIMFDNLNLKNLQKFDSILEKACQLVKSSPELLDRVEKVRLGVDRAILIRAGHLIQEHFAAGGLSSNFPFDRKKIRARAQSVWEKSIAANVAPDARPEALKQMRIELAGYQDIPVARISKSNQFPGKKVIEFPAYEFSLFVQEYIRIVADPTAESKCAVQVDGNKTAMPTHSGVYASLNNTPLFGFAINPADVKGPGYQYYKLGETQLPYHNTVLYTLGWLAQLPLDRITYPLALLPQSERQSKTYEVWLRLKYTGSNYPHGKANEPNAIWVDKALLVEKTVK